MLKQILKDMYVDPEILAGLDDTQKQTLFCKMREEQIRRWTLWDKEAAEKKSKECPSTQKTTKRVDFLKGEDEEPWVWVMGEHPQDKTIETILAEEAQEKARALAVIEAKEMRKSVEATMLCEMIDLNEQNDKKMSDDEETPKIDEMEIYCSVDELRERMNQTKPAPPPKNINLKNLQNIYGSRVLTNFNFSSPDDKKNILQEISLNNRPTSKVSARVALWEKRVIGERTTEIFKRIQEKQLECAKEAEENAKKQEALWQEQERKAKVAEVQIREIARRAREEHRKSTIMEDPNETATYATSYITSQPTSLDPSAPRPPNQEAVLKWYREEEYPRKAGLEDAHRPSQWFHGLLSRAASEQRLMPEPAGTFLVRISEKIWGYAISYRATDKCKHYLIDASNKKYQFFGANQLAHESLGDLINWHKAVPITIIGNELLTRPCPLSESHSMELLDDLINTSSS